MEFDTYTFQTMQSSRSLFIVMQEVTAKETDH